MYALDLPDASFDIVHAHQVLQHLTDPVAALREMRRVCKPDGVVAARDSDYAAMTWYPEIPALTRWLSLYHDVTRSNGAEADAGRRLARVGTRRGLLRRARRRRRRGATPLPTNGTGGAASGPSASSPHASVNRRRSEAWQRATTSPRSPPAGTSGERPTTVGSPCCTARSSARPEALLLLVFVLQPGTDPEDVPVGVAEVELAHVPHLVDGGPRDLQPLARRNGRTPRRRRRRRSRARRRRRRVHLARRRTRKIRMSPQRTAPNPGGASGSGDQANPGRKPTFANHSALAFQSEMFKMGASSTAVTWQR